MPYLGQSPSKGDENNFKILDDISSYTLTFDGSDASVVSAANDTITSLSHRFVQGQRVTYNKGGGGVIAGLSDGVYYIIKHDHHTIKLATSASNATNGIAVNITNVGSGSSHTLNVAFDGVNTKFKATHTNGQKAKITRSAQLVISINGVIQQPHDSATPSTGFGFDLDGTIVLSQAPVAGDIYWAHVLTNNNVTFDISDNDIDNFTGNGSTTTFNLTKSPPDNRNVLVTIDGVIQYPNDPDGTVRAYSVVENVLTFVTAPASGVEIQVRHIGFAGSTSGSGGVTNFYGRTGSVVLKNTDNIVANNAEFAGNLTVQGTMTTLDTKVTEVDQLEVAANNTTVGVAITQSGTGDILNLYDGSSEVFSVTDGGAVTSTGDITITNTAPKLILTDTDNNSDFRIKVESGQFDIDDTTSSNATRFRIYSNGEILIPSNVGFGVANPAEKVDVDGNIKLTGDITISSAAPTINLTETNGDPDYRIFCNGGIFNIVDVNNSVNRIEINSNRTTINNPTLINDNILYVLDTITHWGDDNTKIRFPAADTISMETAGSTRFGLSSSGNVEIHGTQTGNNVATIYNGTGFLGFYASSNSGVNRDFRFYSSNSNSNESFRIRSDGNVQIGDSPTNLAAIGAGPTLGINGAAPEITLRDTATNNPYAWIATNDLGSLVLAADQGNNANSSIIDFRVDGTETLRITSGGRVLINNLGNATPGLSNNADDIVLGYGTQSGETGITMFSTAGSGIRFNDNSGTDGAIEYAHAAREMRFNAAGANRLTFGINAANSPVFNMGVSSGDANNHNKGDRASVKVGDYLSIESATGAGHNSRAGLGYNCYFHSLEDFYCGTNTPTSGDNRPAAYGMAYGNHYFYSDASNTAHSAQAQLTMSRIFEINRSGQLRNRGTYNGSSSTSNNFPALNVNNLQGSYTAGNIIGGVTFGKSPGHSSGIRAGMLALYSNTGSDSGNVGTNLVFRTASESAGDSTERLRIKSDGNITISNTTTSPSGDFRMLTLIARSDKQASIGFAQASGVYSGATATGGYTVRLATDAALELATHNSNLVALKALQNGNVESVGIVTAKNFNPTDSQLSHRNIVINGDMRVSQRGNGTNIGNAGSFKYACDRFIIGLNGATVNITQDAPAAGSNTHPNGFRHSLKLQTHTAVGSVASGNIIQIQYKFEGYQIARLGYGSGALYNNPKSMTLSFWAKSSLTGTFCVNFQRDGRIINRQFTISSANTWTYFTATMPPDTSIVGQHENVQAMSMVFVISAGSNYTGGSALTNWINHHVAHTGYGVNMDHLTTANATFQITGVQLEEGTVATPFEFRDYNDQLKMCQRYYAIFHPTTQEQIYIESGSPNTHSFWNAPVPAGMRTEPSVNLLGTWTGHGMVSGRSVYAVALQGIDNGGNSGTVHHGSLGRASFRVTRDANGTYNAGQIAHTDGWGNGNAWIGYDAEL